MLFQLLHAFILLVDGIVLMYVTIFFLTNLYFVVLSYLHIRRDLHGEQLRPAGASAGSGFLPVISLLVPAYNEGITIAESLRSLLRLRYPAYEIVICNDGSTDDTVAVLVREFGFIPMHLEYDARVATAPVRGFYESTRVSTPGLRRLVLVDKANGGKADALNAALNLARGDYVTSMDADSLLIPDALLLAVRPIVEDPDGVVAVGAQVGILNGSQVENGRVVELRLPPRWIARFQVVEYMRSFAQGRTALAAMDSLPVLSGVFSLMRRETVLAVGGFLTTHIRSRIAREYCGPDAHTVCEDMEIIVRLHRYLLDKSLPGRVVIIPFPTAWTECPENYRDLGRQRARWYRGLWEVLAYHRAVLFDPRFRKVGMFALPYQLIFEALAPVFECVGYALFLVCLAGSLLSFHALLAFLSFAMAVNLALSTLAVLLCVFSERATAGRVESVSLFSYRKLRDVTMLLWVGVVSNFGYRQYLVAWQLKGLWDFLRGRKGWDKFARVGFVPTR